MGEILKAFEFPESAGKAKYEWAELLDGQIRRVRKGKDFDCECQSFGQMARHAAERREVGLNVSVNAKEGWVVLQSYKLSDEELRELKAKKAKEEAEKQAEKEKAKEEEGKDEPKAKKGKKAKEQQRS